MTKCFVIGPIGEAGSPIRAAADDFIKYIVTPVVTSDEFGYGPPIRADSLNEPGRITSQIIKLLLEAELVVADLTGNNANVFYELSLRHAIGKPVVHMAHDGTPLSFDVRDNRTIFYTMHSRVAENARAELSHQIRHVRQPGYKPMNPILETMGILSLERSELPEQKALGKIMEMVEQVNSAVSDIHRQLRTQGEDRAASQHADTMSNTDLLNLLSSTATFNSSLSRALKSELADFRLKQPSVTSASDTRKPSKK